MPDSLFTQMIPSKNPKILPYSSPDTNKIEDFPMKASDNLKSFHEIILGPVKK